ncbi:hypothetical protein BaRGS_00006792, partial [Batillaria attramentaria]
MHTHICTHRCTTENAIRKNETQNITYFYWNDWRLQLLPVLFPVHHEKARSQQSGSPVPGQTQNSSKTHITLQHSIGSHCHGIRNSGRF